MHYINRHQGKKKLRVPNEISNENRACEYLAFCNTLNLMYVV